MECGHYGDGDSVVTMVMECGHYGDAVWSLWLSSDCQTNQPGSVMLQSGGSNIALSDPG